VTIFADASALIAIILNEPEASDLADRLEAGSPRLCSPLSVWDTVAGLCRARIFRSQRRACTSPASWPRRI